MQKGKEYQPIKAINRTAVNQICSGQVVLTLATAVKELLENSLDANATSLQIRLKEFGSESIEVVDNGHGVEESNFQGLTLKHYTSKISEFADVASVETFGFRGEALSSLCTLGKVSIVTRHTSADIGTLLRIDHNGVIADKSPIARQIGTTVTVENLFYTLPVRHKEFLRNLRKEFGKMCSVIYAYALMNCHCSIACTNRTGGRSKPVMETRAGSVRNNIISIFGTKQNVGLMEIQSVAPDEETLAEFRCSAPSTSASIAISGLISSCAHGLGRSSPDRQFFYINSRPVDNTKIARLLNDIYHQYNPHQYPFVFLDIRVTGGSVDVNVVPDKRQVLLEHESLLLATIKSSLLTLYRSIPASMPLQMTRLPDRGAELSGRLFDNLQNFRSSSAQPTNSAPIKTQSTLSKFLKRNNVEAYSNVRSIKLPGDDEFINSNKKMKFAVTCIAEPSPVQIIENEEVPENSSFDTSTTDLFELSSVPDIQDEVSSLGSVVLSQESVVSIETTCTPLSKIEISKDLNEEMEHEKEDVIIESALIGPLTNDGLCVNHDDKANFMESENEVEVIELSASNEGDVVEVVSDICQPRPTDPPVDDGLSDLEKQRRRTAVYDVSLDDIIKMRESRAEAKKENLNVKFFAKIEPSCNDRAEEELRKELSQDAFLEMKILGQFNKGFIIGQLDGDLFIIDQHATDEKFNFEKLSSEKIQSQRLTCPQPLILTAANEELLQSRMDVFHANGFEFMIENSADATRRVQLTAVPVAKGVTLGHRDVDELLFILEDAPDGQMCRPSRVRDIMASRACRMSVMVGTPLNWTQMRRLVNHMGEMVQPWNCPHGRPTIRHLVSLDLLTSAES